VLSLTAAIGAECAGEGVRVCAIAFGPIHTRIHRKMGTVNTYYRLLLPTASADRMARLAWRAYRMGHRVVVPGILNSFLAWSARALPFEILLPLVGWLMKPQHWGVAAISKSAVAAPRTENKLSKFSEVSDGPTAYKASTNPIRPASKGHFSG
jgi:NAD(P)-dependent dehydrogenase (short-subunit alcohol dehydrogenase family)